MYRPVPSIGSKSCLWVVGWMYQVDVYLRVRRAVMVDGMSIREVSRVFGLHRDTVRKILAYSAPPGYRRQTPPRRPKLEPFTGVIDQILVDDLRRPRKQRHTAQRIFRRLRDEHGLGHCCWTLEVVRAEVQGVRVESVLPCVRARPRGLLEREDVRCGRNAKPRWRWKQMNSEKATAVSPSSSPRARPQRDKNFDRETFAELIPARAAPAYSTCSGVRLES